jgi:hypothetical protein
VDDHEQGVVDAARGQLLRAHRPGKVAVAGRDGGGPETVAVGIREAAP